MRSPVISEFICSQKLVALYLLGQCFMQCITALIFGMSNTSLNGKLAF